MVKHFIPNTLVEALDFKEKYNATIIAGGTDIMVQKRNWADLPAKIPNKIMYIFNLNELNYIRKIDNHLHIGAVTPYSDILKNEHTPVILKKAIEILASPALRNCGTIAGNIGNASPAGDTLPVLYVLEALVVIENSTNSRIIPISEVITDYRKTILEENEIITEIIIPLQNFSKIKFDKIGGRKADAISKVSFAGTMTLKDNKILSIRMALGAVGATVVRSKEIEKTCIGMISSAMRSRKREVIDQYKKVIKPITDQRSNANYRKKVALNLIESFIDEL